MNGGFRAIHRIFNALAISLWAKRFAMRLYRTLLGGLIAAGLMASPAWADRPRDQDRAFEATRHGRSMPLPQIERRVMPFMGGADYLGPEFRGDTYRLKFMRDGRVIWVDVDAATGRIIGRSGR
jgi:hypothetical protein